MGSQRRLAGLDLFRGLAIYAVILVHIDEGVNTLAPSWIKITEFAAFNVPFFLAAAFYLAISKLYTSGGAYPLRSRLARLLFPYAIWSAFYLIYKSTKYFATGEIQSVVHLFQDPLSLVFLGGSSYHLYFLPLLAMGTLLVKFTEFLIKRNISLIGIGTLSLASILLYETILITGNELRNPPNVAFESLLSIVFPEGNSNPLLRLFLVGSFWLFRCLPYIMVAMFLAHPVVEKLSLKYITKYPIFWVIIFVTFNLFGSLLVSKGVEEVVRGYTALIAAIALSSVLKENPLIKNIGLCSFGIYLVHIFFVETFQSIAVRLFPNYVNSVSTSMLLAASILVFLVSWATTELLRRNKLLSRIV